MKKPIKVISENAAEITAVLNAANGRATDHTYTHYSDIEVMVGHFESRLLQIIGAKKNLAGAQVYDRSGGSLPNAYKYSRICTYIKLERRATGWFLTHACAGKAYKEAGKSHFFLTPEQDALVVKRLRASYTVQAAPI